LTELTELTEFFEMINRMTQSNRGTDALAKQVIGCAMKVHRTLGCGFLESIYGNALAIELQNNGITFEREKRFHVFYQEIEIGYFDADFLIENSLVVELKAVEALAVIHSVQLVNYLTAGKLDLGLLLNFGTKSLEFKTKTRNHLQANEPPNLQS
jgi:GxxExxY protein